MKNFQGWKIKIAAITAVLLVIGGSVAAFWPKQPLLASQQGVSRGNVAPPLVGTLEALASAPKTEPEATPPASSTDGSQSPTTPVQTTTSLPVTTQPVTTQPAPQPQPVDPPVVVDPPYDPPTHCGGCGQLPQAKGIMCPMTTNGSMSAQICRLNQE